MMPPAQGGTPFQNAKRMCSRDPGWSFYPSWVPSYVGNFSSSKSYQPNTSQNPPDKLRYWIWSALLEEGGSSPPVGRLPAHKPNLACKIPNRQVGSWAAQPAPLATYWLFTGKTHQLITAFTNVSFGRSYKPNLEVVTLAWSFGLS